MQHGHSRMLSLAYTLNLLSETLQRDPGQPVENDQISSVSRSQSPGVRTAITRFTRAVSPQHQPWDPIPPVRRVLARALLNRGGTTDYAAAAAAVASVPSDFVYETEHATTPANLHNGVFEAFNNGEFGVNDLEGTNGLNYVSALDLRVTGDSGLGSDLNTPTWLPNKYPGFDASVPLADYLEAQLIIAESELRSSAFDAMTQRLNTLRAGAGLDPLSTPGDLTAATDLLFRERAFWLFATGHRLGAAPADPPVRETADTVFPWRLFQGV